MMNLLRANFARLKKSKAYWLCLLAVFVSEAIMMLNSVRMASLYSAANVTLDKYYFDAGPFLCLIVPIFASLFVGTEYSDGTIRNKLIVGCSRVRVFMSILLTVWVGCLGFVAAWYIGGLVGLPALGAWKMGIVGMLRSLLISILFALVLGAVFTILAMLFAHKATNAVLSIVLGLAILLTGSLVYNMLCEPEMSSSAYITDEGEFVISDPYPNPHYVAEPMRKVWRGFINSIPSGQAILIANDGEEKNIASNEVMIVSSVCELVLLSWAGCAAFRRKDIK